jgi:hypothetical protein
MSFSDEEERKKKPSIKQHEAVILASQTVSLEERPII